MDAKFFEVFEDMWAFFWEFIYTIANYFGVEISNPNA